MNSLNRAARFPTTTNKARAEEYAKLNTRKSFDGKRVGRVVEVSPGQYAVLVDCNGEPRGAITL